MPEKRKDMALVALTCIFLYGFLLWAVLKPVDAQSVSERRPLAAPPAASWDTVCSGVFMADFEEYALDQFPLRDTLRTVKALTALYAFRQKDNNEVYLWDGYISKLDYPLNLPSVDYAASRFRYVYEQYLADKDMAVYLSVIPDKNCYMAAEHGAPALNYADLVTALRARLDFAQYIDLFPFLELSDYYRTDSHWRQENITDAAQYLAGQMGATLSGGYTCHLAEVPFYGVYYGQAALPLPGEALYYLSHAALEDCQVYDYETGTDIPLYDPGQAAGRDPYAFFLAGPKSLLKIENPHATTEKELILFRDSFGSGIAPLLAEGYASVTLVDIRYISPSMLGQFISFTDQDVLFLYSTSVLNHSETIK